MKRKEKPTGQWQARNRHLLKQVVLSKLVESLNVWFRWTTPINQKRSIRNLFFYLSSNSFASFLSQTSNLVHRSLHLSTWSPRFTSHDLYLRCWSLASRAKRSFYLGPLKINGSIVVVTPNYLCFDCIILEKNYEDINTTVSFSVLRCFRSTGCLFLIIAHERMYLLSLYS